MVLTASCKFKMGNYKSYKEGRIVQDKTTEAYSLRIVSQIVITNLMRADISYNVV